LVLADGKTAVASDPDRDAIYVVDTFAGVLTHTVTLTPGDEPGRVIEDGAGRVHVALRSGGAVVTLDPATGKLTDRAQVCPAPRGLAWDSSSNSVWVACATGELMALPAGGGAATTQWVVERDIRDITVTNGAITLSKFRSAELLRISSSGTVVRRDAMPTVSSFVPHVARRTFALPSGDTMVVHQEHSSSSVATKVRGGYAPGGVAIVGSQCTIMGPSGDIKSTFPVTEAEVFDAVISADGSSIAFVGAEPANGIGSSAPVVEVLAPDGSPVSTGIPASLWAGYSGGQLTAAAFNGQNNLVLQTREPAALIVVPASLQVQNLTPISLSSVSRDDLGHDLFHTPTPAMIACASCHPEGGDDGHVWILDGQTRRTPSLRGTIADTAPYHWAGDEMDFPTLVNDVFVNRMSAGMVTTAQTTALSTWVSSIPAPPAPSWVDLGAASRGAALFTNATLGCSTCHSGAKFTNNLTVDVGTGGLFQVPPLVGVGWRLPLMHDGCAQTFADRFGACATPGHGVTAALTSQNIGDLSAYLDTL
jgi:DNA-binding beta-propeller fold protein YncE